MNTRPFDQPRRGVPWWLASLFFFSSCTWVEEWVVRFLRQSLKQEASNPAFFVAALNSWCTKALCRLPHALCGVWLGMSSCWARLYLHPQTLRAPAKSGVLPRGHPTQPNLGDRQTTYLNHVGGMSVGNSTSHVQGGGGWGRTHIHGACTAGSVERASSEVRHGPIAPFENATVASAPPHLLVHLRPLPTHGTPCPPCRAWPKREKDAEGLAACLVCWGTPFLCVAGLCLTTRSRGAEFQRARAAPRTPMPWFTVSKRRLSMPIRPPPSPGRGGGRHFKEKERPRLNNNKQTSHHA